MADLEDLGIESILNTSADEGIERLRQIRLSRRTQKTAPKKVATRAAKKQEAKAIPKLSANQAANLLNLLEDEL